MNKENHLKTPLYTALCQYAEENIIHFDVPGHKKRYELGGIYNSDLMKYDANSTKQLDILSNPTGVIAEAEELIADAYHADYAFMLVNGSTFGVIAMIMTACSPRDKIIMPRNVHKSAINGVILSGAIPIFIDAEVDYEYGIANGVTYESVKKAVNEHPDAKALFIINPTYFGAASDLKAIISLCKRKNIAVLADEAHGAHLPFYEEFPDSAIGMGADMSTVSIHKTGGSLTQTSVLLMNERQFKSHQVKTIVNLMQTTSPSYLLMASIDLARNKMVTEGEKIFSKLYTALEEAKNRINKIPGMSCLTRDNINGRGIHDYDETKIVIKVNELGFSGFEVYDLLKNDYNIQTELAETYCVLAVIGIGDTDETIFKLVEALEDISKRFYGKKEPFHVKMTDFFEKPKSVISPREAHYTPKKIVPINEADGDICGEALMIYPPGIPLIIPGERINQKIIEHYWFYVEQNCIVMNDQDEAGYIKILGE